MDCLQRKKSVKGIIVHFLNVCHNSFLWQMYRIESKYQLNILKAFLNCYDMLSYVLLVATHVVHVAICTLYYDCI